MAAESASERCWRLGSDSSDLTASCLSGWSFRERSRNAFSSAASSRSKRRSRPKSAKWSPDLTASKRADLVGSLVTGGSDVEAGATAAVTLRIGVLEHEPLTHEGLLVVHLGPVEEKVGLLVDDDPRALELGHEVELGRLVREVDDVLEPGAAATLQAQAESP